MACDFCLRLACGLMFALLPLTPSQVNQGFYRVHFLTTLGIGIVAAVFAFQSGIHYGTWFWLVLCASLILCSLGSLLWSLDEAPWGSVTVIASASTLLATIGLFHWTTGTGSTIGLADAYTSAALLGFAMTGMLLGHSYLVAPSMSMSPLLRVLGGLAIALAARGSLAAWTLWFWTREHYLANVNDEVTLLLPVRWAVGLVLPLGLTLMAWQTARIRSTQSATGILYVVVIFCFIGELVGLLLSRMSGAMLS